MHSLRATCHVSNSNKDVDTQCLSTLNTARCTFFPCLSSCQCFQQLLSKVSLIQSIQADLALQVEQYLIKTEDIHEDFRLWITAEPHPNFPIGLLQMGIKITNEAPVGMKAGLRASYQWVSQVSHPLSQCSVATFCSLCCICFILSGIHQTCMPGFWL